MYVEHKSASGKRDPKARGRVVKKTHSDHCFTKDLQFSTFLILTSLKDELSSVVRNNNF